MPDDLRQQLGHGLRALMIGMKMMLLKKWLIILEKMNILYYMA